MFSLLSAQTVTEEDNRGCGCQKVQGKWREGRETGSHRGGEMLKKAGFQIWGTLGQGKRTIRVKEFVSHSRNLPIGYRRNTRRENEGCFLEVRIKRKQKETREQ